MNYDINISEIPEVQELQALFSQTTWASKRENSDVEKLLKYMTVYVSIRENDQLIGFGRALSDGVYRALIEDIVVDEAYRKKGLGRVIVEQLIIQLNEIDEVYLNTGPHLEEFYNKFGFKKSDAFSMKLKQKDDDSNSL